MTKGQDKQTFRVLIYVNLLIYQYKHTFLGAQKNCLTETVLLSTHKACSG